MLPTKVNKNSRVCDVRRVADERANTRRGARTYELAHRIGASTSQMPRLLAETDDLEMTVEDFLAEVDPSGRGFEKNIYDRLVEEKLASGIVPYVYDPQNPVPPTEDQMMIDTWRGLARSSRDISIRKLRRMMSAPDEDRVEELHDLIRRACQILEGEGVQVDADYLVRIIES